MGLEKYLILGKNAEKSGERTRASINACAVEAIIGAYFLTGKKTEIVDTQIVTGCTCLEYDRLFTLLNKPRLSVGDKIVYHNVGAYTMSLTPMFIRYVPNIYVKKAKDYVLIRKKFEAKDCLLNTVF